MSVESERTAPVDGYDVALHRGDLEALQGFLAAAELQARQPGLSPS